MAALHIFCVLVCFLKQLQNFALGDIFFFVPLCSAPNLLLSECFKRKTFLGVGMHLFFNLHDELVKSTVCS